MGSFLTSRCLATLSAAVALAACGLAVTGAAPADGHGTSPPETGADAPARGDEGPPASLDACPSMVITDDFSSNDTSKWITGGNVAFAAGAVSLLKASNDHSFGQLFLASPTHVSTFRASFRFHAAKREQGGNLGDGFAFGWLNTGGDAGRLKNGTIGGGLGLPAGVAGTAFIFDTYRNDAPNEIGDPPVPFLALVALDPARGVPGSFKWWLTSSAPRPAGFFGEWHTVTVSSTSGATVVAVDGAVELGPTQTPFDFTGHFGFSAGSGGAEVLVVQIDDFRLELPDAPCP